MIGIRDENKMMGLTVIYKLTPNFTTTISNKAMINAISPNLLTQLYRLMVYKYTKADSHFMIQWNFIRQAYIMSNNLICLVMVMIFWRLVRDFYSHI